VDCVRIRKAVPGETGWVYHRLGTLPDHHQEGLRYTRPQARLGCSLYQSWGQECGMHVSYDRRSGWSTIYHIISLSTMRSLNPSYSLSPPCSLCPPCSFCPPYSLSTHHILSVHHVLSLPTIVSLSTPCSFCPPYSLYPSCSLCSPCSLYILNYIF